MTELYNLIQNNGPGVLIIFAILLFGKKLIEYFFDETIELKKTELNQNLENHKNKLEQENKEFQHLLNIKLDEFNIQFSKLHQERAEIIKSMYQKLIELQSSMTVFTRRIHPIINDEQQERKERLERVNKAIKDFNNYHLLNKIYFKKDLDKKLAHLSKEYWDNGWDFATIENAFNEKEVQKELFKEYYEKSKLISEKVKYDFPKLIEELEDDFRILLGVEK